MARATYEDVLNAPENKVAEILDGELVLPTLECHDEVRLGFRGSRLGVDATG